MNKRFFPVLFFAAVGVIGLSARGVDEDRDSSGIPERIVQVGASAFIVENSLYLFPEARDSVIAVADGDQGRGFFLGDLDPGIASGTILPRSANTETIISLRPDLVVMKNFMKSRMGEPLEKVGVPTFYLDLETPEAWMSDLEALGEIFGNPARAEELRKAFERRIAAVEAPLRSLGDDDRPDTLFLYWSVKDGASAVNVPPANWIQTRMVKMAGGNPVWCDDVTGSRWMKTNLEQVAAWDPEVIVVAAYHVPAADAVESIMGDPGWASLQAVTDGRVHAFPADYHSWDQPDVRWLLGLTWLASELHPDRFAGIDMDEEARGFYSEMFGMDDADYNRMIAPRLTGLD